MNRMESCLGWLGLLYIVGCCAYVGYACYSYTGPYRLAAEWQMSEFGGYSIKITLLLSFVVVTLPGAVAFKLLRSGREASFDTAFEKSFFAVVASPRVMLVAGFLLAAVAAGSGWHIYSIDGDPDVYSIDSDLPYFITMGVSAFGAFCCLMTAAMIAIRRRRLAQT